MKPADLKDFAISRGMRVAVITAVLSTTAIVCAMSGWRTPMWGAASLALAIVTAHFILVVRPARIPRSAVLTIRIAGTLREFPPRSPVSLMLGGGFPALHHLRICLEAAANDAAIRAVVVEIAGAQAGFAGAQELSDLLAAVQARGKRVIALLTGDSVSPREYLIACGAGEIVANPDSAFMLLGVASGGFFLRGALDKLEIQPQTLQWKEYKGAAEIFGRDSMSPELRESLGAIVDDWQRILTAAVSRSRGIDEENARRLLNGGFLSARAACDAKLIDRLGYIEDIRIELEPDGKLDKFVGLARYLRRVVHMRASGRRARIALVAGVGPVIAGTARPGGEFISGETTAAEIDRAGRDERVRAIVFRVNSPGGSAVGSDLVWRAIRDAQRRGKPVIASMGDVAGSGGYYVAMGADAIVAQPSTVTGSIGVLYAHFDVSRLLARLGIGVEYVKSGESADALSLARGLSKSEMAQLNAMIGELYANFTGKVAEGRRLNAGQTEDVARGRVWSGVAAKERGLIDELGGLGRAIEIARDKAGIRAGMPHDLVVYAAPRSLASLRSMLRPADAISGGLQRIAATTLGLPRTWMPAMIELLMRGGAMLLMPLL
jgi:protease-4